MEPVPAASGVRRTVRLAAALVAGQVVLVAIVGWLTLTRAGDRPAPGAPHVDQLAAPGVLIPTVPSPAGPVPSATRAPGVPAGSGTGHSRRTSEPARPPVSETAGHPASPTVPAPVTSSAPLSLVPPPGPAATPSTTPSGSADPDGSTGGAGTTPSAGPSATAKPVLPGEPCDWIYALTRADDGRMVICLPDDDHQLRWKIV